MPAKLKYMENKHPRELWLNKMKDFMAEKIEEYDNSERKRR